MPTDKQNNIDYQWFLVRIQPGNEQKLCDLIDSEKGNYSNILETYCPTTSVRVQHGGTERKRTLFDGYAFVLATQKALVSLLRDKCPNTYLRYIPKSANDSKVKVCTIPEPQMRAFREFNENYADKVVVLERPYTDYAFNTKANEPNEIVRVIDGPLAGHKGYVCRFHRNRGLVFQVTDATSGNLLTVVYPNVFDLHVARLHNAEGDRLSIDTEKARAADTIIGILQACGYGDNTLHKFYEIIDILTANLSLVKLCKTLFTQGDQTLSSRLAQMTGHEAELVINLARYEKDVPGYVRSTWNKITLRPFLTPTSGVEWQPGTVEHELQHTGFTEIIRKVNITEEFYYPSKRKSETVTTAYYSHIGIIKHPETDSYTLFTNWDGFLEQYFLTAGKANEKLVEGKTASDKEKMVESFRNFAPALYKVLTDADSSVKAVKDFNISGTTLNVIALTTTAPAQGINVLLDTCVTICKQINATNRLAVWRRYLRTVWLHV